ncbi:glycosyltransferase [Methylococcus mesophilus]|uniref:glycosyltransferase n=1 Tax=Methylococcus mesophilus TaxID=2993564 RepID=UPI00224A89DC|nr:glycosyltransferase [Methylococcus mesophilus]UZR30353.1 glycosyltransferase [Methylococcus mesophilus]
MNIGTASSDFLFAAWEGGGDMPPLLSAVRRLVGRGHRVRVMSDDCNRPEIEAAGADFVGYREAPNRPDKSEATEVVRDWEGLTPAEGLGRLRDRVMCGAALAYARDVAAEIRHRRPDLVVSIDLLFGPMIGAEAAGVPYAVLSSHVCIHPLAGIPPFGPGFLPARNEEERQRDAAVAADNRAMFNLGLPAVNAARRAFGLPPLNDAAEQLATARRYWLATSPAFDFPADHLPENFRYVGPELDDPPLVRRWESPWSPEDPRPLVLVAFSTTFQNQVRAIGRVADALGRLPVRGLVTLGAALEGTQVCVPDNVAAVRSAPHGVVMREAAAVVTHCGHGTVMKALAQGLPMLCMPMGRDQHDNAARVVARGAGLLSSPDASVAEIAEAVRCLLDDPGFRSAAERLGERVRRDGAGSTLVGELEAAATTAEPTADWRAFAC